MTVEAFIKTILHGLYGGAPSVSRQDAFRLINHIESLEKDQKLLLETIEKGAKDQRVRLSHKVAEAVEYFRNPPVLFDDWRIVQTACGRICPHDNEHTRALKSLSLNERDKLLAALVNGYTVEESKETLERDIHRMISEWIYVPPTTTVEADEREIARRITEHVRKVFENEQGSRGAFNA